MKRNKKVLCGAVTAFLGVSMALNTVAAASFDANYIISDEELLDASTMSLEDIQTFLTNKGGYIANYKTLNAEGNMKTAAEIIYDAANNYDCSDAEMSDNPTLNEKKRKCKKVTINPKMLLVLLQKEQSLIEDKTPTVRQLDWATGYGCPDGQACNNRWRGFGKQVNSAALQFFDYLARPNYYKYKAGGTYTVTNCGSRPKSLITPVTQATAALYNYTPHVYNGNYNFHKLWNEYFTRVYPENSLLQAKGEPGVWMIKNGKKRPFMSKQALTSRYDTSKIIQVGKSDLDKYPKGAPIRFPQYAIIRSPRGTKYLLVDDKRREFADAEAFRVLGYNPEEVMDASWEDVLSYDIGKVITASSTYPTGALLQNKETGGIYYVQEGEKAPLWDSVLLKTMFKRKSIVQVDSEELDRFKTVSPVKFGTGELLTSPASPAVYMVEGNKKRAIVSGDVFEALGYKWENVITVSPKLLNLYENGDDIVDVYLETEEKKRLELARK